MTVYEQLQLMFNKNGDELYFGEKVSQEAHALQSAYQAEQEGAPDALVVAALVHDVGHMLHGLGEDIAEQGLDGHHEDVGEAWLARHFGPEVTRPVQLHVAAKRYLCTVEPDYRATLSPASVRSYELQGGAMTPEEVAAFEADPHYREAVRLRRWDDRAKILGLDVPNLEHYRDRIEGLTLEAV